ncbi:flavin reductase family protein [Streptomyces sp. NPDC059477]|uniref:flavin reductase family protein n=1 Tax=Streptomyces sp. NPDC059477 TaxID=3346847 RepID=UPI00369EBB0C
MSARAGTAAGVESRTTTGAEPCTTVGAESRTTTGADSRTAVGADSRTAAGVEPGGRRPPSLGPRAGGTVSDAFRAAARGWTTGVAVVTARHGEEVFAKTVSSLCTLSMDPLLVSVAVSARSPLAAAVRADGRYAVAVLAGHQEPLARHFAAPGAGRALSAFTVAPMRTETTGAPVLEDCLAWFDCRLHTVLPGGDHALLVGRVAAADAGTGEPLVYHHGAYRSLAPPPPPPPTHLPSTGA